MRYYFIICFIFYGCGVRVPCNSSLDCEIFGGEVCVGGRCSILGGDTCRDYSSRLSFQFDFREEEVNSFVVSFDSRGLLHLCINHGHAEPQVSYYRLGLGSIFREDLSSLGFMECSRLMVESDGRVWVISKGEGVLAYREEVGWIEESFIREEFGILSLSDACYGLGFLGKDPVLFITARDMDGRFRFYVLSRQDGLWRSDFKSELFGRCLRVLPFSLGSFWAVVLSRPDEGNFSLYLVGLNSYELVATFSGFHPDILRDKEGVYHLIFLNERGELLYVSSSDLFKLEAQPDISLGNVEVPFWLMAHDMEPVRLYEGLAGLEVIYRASIGSGKDELYLARKERGVWTHWKVADVFKSYVGFQRIGFISVPCNGSILVYPGEAEGKLTLKLKEVHLKERRVKR